MDIELVAGEIDLMPSSEAAEIAQNIRTILLTAKGSVPLDREFGMDMSIIDKPLNVVQSRYVAAAAEAISRYEPRVRLKEIIWSESEKLYGELRPIVRVVLRQ